MKKRALPVLRWGRSAVIATLVAGGLSVPTTLLAQDFTAPEEEITDNKVTSWIGNTYGGVWDGERSVKSKTFGRSRRGHVPMGIDAIAVADDGTVYTRALQPDESHKQYGVFTKEGDDLGQLGWYHDGSQPYFTETRGDAIAVGGDYVVAENSNRVTRIIDGEEKRITDFGRLRVFSRSTGAPTKTSNDRNPDVNVSDNVTGLAIWQNELYVSDYPENRILVYDLDTLAVSYSPEPIRTFSFAEPGRLTVDGEGYLWIVRQSDNRIYQYARSGESQQKKVVLPEGSIADDVQYNDSEGNTYAGLLMVADNGPDLNIKFYDPKKATGSATPATPEATFGEKGGIYSGVPGEYKPTKFRERLTGIDNDADGNLYVSMAGTQRVNAHTSLLSFKPSGELRWDRHNLAFIDVGVMDPRSENDVYSEFYRYRVEYNQGFEDNQAKGWSIKGYTMDTARYPDDIRNVAGIKYNRLGQAMAPLKIVYVEDQKIIFYGHQLGQYLAAFRVSPTTDGEILIPCMVMSKKYRPEMPWPAQRPATEGAWIWMDQNGDGQMEAEEFISSGQDYKGWAWDINDNADIWWLASSSNDIKRSVFQGLTEQGVPQYDFEHVEDYETPELFTSIKRIIYDDGADVMYITGYNEAYPNRKPFEVGEGESQSVWSAAAGRVLARFDDWSEGNRQPRWVVENFIFKPQKQKHTDIFITSVDEAGDYLFLGRNSGERYGKESKKSGKIPNTRKVEVYRKSDGSSVGYLLPGPQANHGIGQLDMIYGIRAFQRQNGQYVVFEEDDWFGNILVHQWSPGDQPQPQPPGQRPYQGVAHTLPGTIEGEHYDEGGAEVAYHDDNDKEGDDSYRKGDKVDVTEKAEASNGRSVGFTEEGEWLEYTVNAQGGTYEVVLTTATGTDERGDLQMSLDGEVIGTFSGADLANEGWLTFQTLTLSGVAIPEGEGQVLRLEYVNGGGFDLDAIAFVKVGSSDATGLAPVADASVRDGAYRNENYGSEVYLWIKNAQADFTRRSLLRFDISDLERETSTELVLTVASLGGENVAERSVAVHALSDDSWQEGEVTWDNQPAVGELLATVTVGEADEGESVRVDVTEYVAEQSGTVGFALVQPGGQNAIVSFASRESDTPPLLRGQTEALAQENASLAPATARLEGSPDVLLYPNPVEEVLRVRRSVVTQEEVPKTSGAYAAGSRTTEGAVLRILSLTGQLLIRQALDASGEVNVSTLPPGMYIVRISQPGMPEQQTKIIKR